MRITFEVHEGLAIFEGDIILGPVDAIATSPEQLDYEPDEGMALGIVQKSETYRWPNGVVPYEIDPSLPNPGRVTSAISYIEGTTPGVDLRPRAGEANYVRFVPSTGCSASVGRIGGRQFVNLATNCSTGNTIHEVAHALGLWHEQSRCDRDSFVEILRSNIQPGYEHNFDSRCSVGTDLFEYAEGSIMHYSRFAFSVNGQPTIRSKRGLDHLMGNSTSFGPTDIKTINEIYPSASVVGWVSKAPLPTPRKQFAGGTAKTLLYAVGGTTANSANVVATVESYNPSTNTWTTRASLPSPRWRTGNPTAIDGLLYVAGGVGAGSTGVTKTLYAYNTANNTWSAKAAMPVAGGCGGTAAVGTILFVMLGCDVTTSPTAGAKGILLSYDPAKNAWTTKAAAPSAHQFGGIAAIGSKLYVVGGKAAGGAASNKLEVYNSTNNTWSTKASLPAARYSHATHAINGKIYVVGGNDASNGFTNTTYVYDPGTNAWSTLAPMSTARAGHGGGTIGKVLYEVGGYNSTVAVSGANESLKP